MSETKQGPGEPSYLSLPEEEASQPLLRKQTSSNKDSNLLLKKVQSFARF